MPYAALAGGFCAGVGGALYAASRAGHRLPARLDARDLLLLGVATQQSSRLLSRDPITRFVREPFTVVDPEGDAPPGELREHPRRHEGALRRAVGELLCCTLCLDMWIAGIALIGLTVAPRATRSVSSLLAVKGTADLLQLGYARYAGAPSQEPPARS